MASEENQMVRRKLRNLSVVNGPNSQGQVCQEWVFVTHVVNPNHFYVRRVAEKKAGALLSKKINSLCSEETALFTAHDVLQTGSTIFVRWKENAWCRAVLREVVRRGHGGPVTRCPAAAVSGVGVYFPDDGFSRQLSFPLHEDLDEDPFQQLNECLRKVDMAAQCELNYWAPQAVNCSLKDIVPPDQEVGWSSESCAEFQHVVGTKVVEMQVFGRDRGVLLVDLKKAPMDESRCVMPLSLREHLVFLELARFNLTVWNVGTVSCDRRTMRFLPPVLPAAGRNTSAVVSHVDSPSDFHIQLVDGTDLRLLVAELQKCCSEQVGSGRQAQGISQPALNQACVARREDNLWHRAEVTGLPGVRQVEVRYVDFGDKKTLFVTDIRKIEDTFLALPVMAVHCCLADVEPLSGTTWSQECKKRFWALVGQKLSIVAAGEPVCGGVAEQAVEHAAVPVRLFEVSSTGDPSANIGDLLVEDGLGRYSNRRTPEKEAAYPETVVWDPPLESHLEEEGTELCCVHMDLRTALQLFTSMEDLRVRVTHVTSPGSFFVQLLQMDFSLKRVRKMLKEEYAQSEVLQLEWKPQMDCAACVNGVWERGEVLRCDFGSKVKLHPDKLRLLQPRLVGHLVLECSLAGIRPTGGCPTWTATACDFISDHLSGALAVINIKSCRRRPPVPVVLRCSSGPGQDVSFADLLVTRGLALKEELASSFPSEMPEEAVVQVENVQEAEEKPWKPVCCRYFPEKMKREPYPPPELPPRGRVQVTVTAVGDDGTIYAMTQQAERQCEQLKDGFQHHMKTFTRHKFYRWQRGMGCAVMGSDMTWYRGKVLEVIGEHVKVRYVDQGLVEEIPVCHVYPTVLREDVPELCVSCQLHGLIPIGGTWQPDAVTLLKELLHMRRLDILMMELPLEPWGDVTVQINLEGMNLSRIMVHHQHATADSAVAEEYVTVPSTARLDNWAIDHTGVKDPPLVPGKFRCSSLPDKGEHFRVQIKHLCTPNEVFLSVFSEPDNLNSEENLEEALRSVNEGEDRLFPLVDFAPERACLAKYSDGKYYRAKLLSIEGCNPVQILVRHVDYGSDDVVSTRRLRQMPLDLLKFPCEAIKVKVGGFRAPRGKLEQERILYQPEWSIKAMLEMISLLHGNITASVVSTESEITVFLYNERGVLVHHSLVEKGLADED